MKIEVPEKVEFIIDQLMKHGYEAYAVGGCVRDSILNRVPGDWDITTSASPYEVKQIFHRTIDTGIQHGTVTVMLDKDGFEVTTYRLDGEYEDCRHPKQVEFTKNLTEDLKRRDFTINAMAYNEQEGMVDLFEGLEDINRRVIRCVGSAMDRFEEDALRILRAVRFSAQLNFAIEEETRQAIIKKAPNLKNISAERIREELNKLLLSVHPDHLMTAYETGITNVVFPEFDAWKDKEGIIQELMELSKEREEMREMLEVKPFELLPRTLTSKECLCLAYALLLQPQSEEKEAVEEKKDSEETSWTLCEEAAEQARKVMRRLKFDNETIQMVTRLVKFHDVVIASEDYAVRKAMNQMSLEVMDLWFVMKEIELKAALCCDASKVETQEKMQKLEDLFIRYHKSIQAKECVTLKMLQITGKDLIELGYRPGVELGATLEKLLAHVLQKPLENDLETLKEIAAKMKIS